MEQGLGEAVGRSFDILPTECVDVFLAVLRIRVNSGYFLHTVH